MEPLFQIGGIASGLDTSSILSQLMAIERVPVTRFQQQQTELRRTDQAWGQVVQRLSGFRSAVDQLRQPRDWEGFTTATSSNEAAVSVSATSAGSTGSLSFTVQRLATAHQVASGSTYASRDTLVGAGSVTIRDASGTEVASITTTATTTLDDLADLIDDAGVGVEANVLKVDDDQFRLVASATGSGDAKQFTLETDLASFGTVDVLTTGQDAHLTVGSLDVYRSSNTIDDLVEGARITLRATTTDPVTVATSRDSAAVVEKVQAMVTAANEVLANLDNLTRYNPETGEAGLLQGSPLARRLAFDLRSAISQSIAGGSLSHASQVGIGLTRDGRVELDVAALEAAVADDFDAVADFFGQSATTPDGVSFSSATAATVPGTYGIDITTAARVASATGATYSPPVGSPKVFTVATTDGKSVDVTIDEGMTAAQAVARINTALAQAGLTTLEASVVDDGLGGEAIGFTESRFGSAHGFALTGFDGVTDGEFHHGEDVAGSIGGVAAEGTGQSLRATSGDASGLVLKVTSETTGALGDVTYESGLGGVLDRYLDEFEGVDGLLQGARDRITGEIRGIDDRIAAFEVRLDSREITLRRKFTAMETALGQLQSQSAWLSSQLASLTVPKN